MKHLIIIALIMVLTSCSDNATNDHPKEFTLDPGSTVLVNGKESKATTDTTETCEYIVKNAAFLNLNYLNEDGTVEIGGGGSLGLQPDVYEISRDLVGHKFKFFDDEVIDNGKPGRFFSWVDMTFTVAVYKGKRIHPFEYIMPFDEITEDTVAYIPNSVARECKAKILKALEVGNLEECYRIFREDYTYVPITGAELRRLKAEGLDNVK